MIMNAAQIKEAAHSFGADLVGFVSTETLRHLPAKENPLSVFPQAKTVIVVGRRIPRGTLQGVASGANRSNSFKNFGFMELEDVMLSKTTYDVCIWMEAHGLEAVPMFGYDAEAANKVALGSPVAPDKPAPNVYVDWMKMAQAAGLGEVGLNGLFITPEFGTLQRFALLLSDEEVDCGAPKKFDFCKGCDACVVACPVQSIEKDQIDAKGVAARHENRCRSCKTGAVPTNIGRFDTIDRIAAACGRACLASLEKRNLIRKRFNSSFADK